MKPHDHVACLFLIFCIHFIALSIIIQSLSLCIFTKISWSTINFKTKNGSWLITEYYAFTIGADEVNVLQEKCGVSAYRQISMVVDSSGGTGVSRKVDWAWVQNVRLEPLHRLQTTSLLLHQPK